MLILFQDGETAVILTEPFKIEIDRIYDNPMTVFELYHKEPPKVVSWNVSLTQNDTVETLGEYGTLEEAKQTIRRFMKAYERGDMAFRVE